MPTLRQATKSDAPALARLQEQTFRDTFEASNSRADMTQHCTTHYGIAQQEREILDPHLITLLCEEQGALIGFAQLRWNALPVENQAKQPAEIQRIYVDKNWHGTGVAQMLMQHAIDLLRERGADLVWLGVWENNPRAINFYKKYDFAEVGEHVFMVGQDAQRDIILRKFLRLTG